MRPVEAEHRRLELDLAVEHRERALRSGGDVGAVAGEHPLHHLEPGVHRRISDRDVGDEPLARFGRVAREEGGEDRARQKLPPSCCARDC